MGIRLIDYRPPKIGQFFVLLAVLIHYVTPLGRVQVYANMLWGVALGAAGFAIMTGGWWMFRRSGAAISPTAKTDHLIISSIYRYTRNPMYLGMEALIMAIAVIVGTLPFYLAATAYFIVLNNVFCPYEERKLTASFGTVYLDYKNKVRRWL